MVKHAPWAVALASLAAFITLAGFTVVPESRPGSSPERTAYSFAHALAAHNFGRACSYYAQKPRDSAAQGGGCAAALTAYVGQIATFFGADIVDHMHVVAGSKHANKDGSVSFKIVAKGGQPTPIKVVKQPSGNWRIV